MSIWVSIIYHGFTYSVVLSLMVTISQLFNARLWLQDYPDEIKQTVPPKTRRERLLSLVVGVPFLLFIFIYPMYITHLIDFNSFYIIFVHIFGIGIFGNLFDLLILDWLIFCYWTPDYLIVDNTDDHVAYKKYSFHCKGFLKGTIIFCMYSLIATIFLFYL